MNEIVKQNSKSLSSQLKKQNQLIGDWVKNSTDLQIARTYDHKKIGDFNKEDMKSLVEIMGKWKFLLGVQNEATDQELIFICQFVYDEFKKFTLEDIKIAMHWAISGKTDLTYVSQKTLSAAYVSKAIQAYEEEKRHIIQKIAYDKEVFERKKAREEKLDITVEEKMSNFKNILITEYNNYKTQGRFYDFGDFIYNWIKNNKIVNTTKSLVSDAMIYGERKSREFNIKTDEIKRPKVLEYNMNDSEFRKKKFAREYIIMKFFDKITLEQLSNLVKINQFKK